jgi:ABC-type transporter Mla subunit MlaD
MSTKTHNLRIGLVVVCGALLLLGGLFAVGLQSYFGEREIYETAVPGKVESLSVGALVTLRGVTIGKVNSIEFSGKEYPGSKQQAVIIQFEIPKGTVWGEEHGDIQHTLDAEAAQGLRARVQGQGFLGAGMVALEYVDPKIYPTKAPSWTPKHYYIPSAPSQFNRVLTSVEKSLRQTEDLDLARLLERADTLLDAAHVLVQRVNEVDFKQLGTNADLLLVDLRETNRGLQRTLAAAQTTLSNAQAALIESDLPGLSRKTGDLESKIASAAVELRRTLASLNTVELNNSLANVRVATDELNVLLHGLEQRPSAVLFSKPPKPVLEMETPPAR